ncbi:helix-turn-helix transcriptional regulator [Caulobacter sp. 17J80-11]|nr:helix-turn-helix transcriptional regulator [Caulobacter sp. 17J80-11]
MREAIGVGELGIERLTPRERECLRLVAQHLRSKEIARRLNISQHTVDAHLNEARRRLGAATRREAALMLLLAEGGSPLPALLKEVGGEPGGMAPVVPIASDALEYGGFNGRYVEDQSEPADAGVDLGRAGGRADPARRQPGAAGDGRAAGVGGGQADGGALRQRDVAGNSLSGDGDRGRVVRAGAVGRADRDDLSGALSALARMAVLAIGSAFLLAGVLLGAHQVLVVMQTWNEGGLR